MPGTPKLEIITTANGSDLRQLEIQYNRAVFDLQQQAFAGSIDAVWSWQAAGVAVTGTAVGGQALGMGSTDTAVATAALGYSIAGIPAAKAAVTTGTAVTAQTVPADTWAAYAFNIATSGTLSMLPAALNTTGYATEALAIAAVPAPVTVKARLGYITVKTAASTAWIGATDAFQGGTSGNPASITHYYPYDGIFAPSGTAVSCQLYIPGTTTLSPNGYALIGGRNGMLIGSTLSRGTTVTLAATACTYNANGICNIPKAALTAQAFGALGTVPADQWAVIAMLYDSLGNVSFLSGDTNYSTGYPSEGAAVNALSGMLLPTTAGLQTAMPGYITLKTKAATAWIAGTDALAGGSGGNPASITNYYSTPGITLNNAMLASPIAGAAGRVLTSVQY